MSGPYAVADAPAELRIAIVEFWPEAEWDNAAGIARLESGWDAFARHKTTDLGHPCGSTIGVIAGVTITAEDSIGFFQINTCNLPPDWEPGRLYNARHNAGTAHAMWAERGWSPWYYSAQDLGLL
jgi:hypothetical protein